MSIYSDLNQNTPTVSPLVLGLDSIYQSIDNILSTSTHSRLFNLKFGSELESLLFDPMTDITIAKMMDAIIYAISRWDDRIKIDYNESNITPNYEENKYELLLVFKIIGIEEVYEYNGEIIRP